MRRHGSLHQRRPRHLWTVIQGSDLHSTSQQVIYYFRDCNSKGFSISDAEILCYCWLIELPFNLCSRWLIICFSPGSHILNRAANVVCEFTSCIYVFVCGCSFVVPDGIGMIIESTKMYIWLKVYPVPQDCHIPCQWKIVKAARYGEVDFCSGLPFFLPVAVRKDLENY